MWGFLVMWFLLIFMAIPEDCPQFQWCFISTWGIQFLFNSHHIEIFLYSGQNPSSPHSLYPISYKFLQNDQIYNFVFVQLINVKIGEHWTRFIYDFSLRYLYYVDETSALYSTVCNILTVSLQILFKLLVHGLVGL